MSFPFLETLPEPGALETASLEFKARLSGKGAVDRFEIAKDVAALANTIGGTLLIGASYKGGTPNRLEGYAPHTNNEAADVVKVAEEAIRDRCFPAATFAPRLLTRGSGVVVALDVPPMPAPVAVRIKTDENTHRHDAYVFFERVTAQTRPFSPEILPVLMEPRIRRIAILLRSIPNDALVEIREKNGIQSFLYKELRVDELRNCIIVKNAIPGTGELTQSFPLDAVLRVHCDHEGQWRLQVAADAHWSTT